MDADKRNSKLTTRLPVTSPVGIPLQLDSSPGLVSFDETNPCNMEATRASEDLVKTLNRNFIKYTDTSTKQGGSKREKPTNVRIELAKKPM